MLQRCGPPAVVSQSHRAEEKRARDVKGEEEGSVGTATSRKRALGLEPSQGHPDCTRAAEEGERRSREEDDNCTAAKRARLISGRCLSCLSLHLVTVSVLFFPPFNPIPFYDETTK